jgi:hypothetical protein
MDSAVFPYQNPNASDDIRFHQAFIEPEKATPI